MNTSYLQHLAWRSPFEQFKVYTIWLCFLRNIRNCINVVLEKIILKDFISMGFFSCWNLTSFSWNPSNDPRVTVWTLYILHYTLKLWWNIRFLERGFLNKSRHPNFTILWLFPTLKKVWQFTLTTLSSLGMHCTKFSWIWPSGSIED